MGWSKKWEVGNSSYGVRRFFQRASDILDSFSDEARQLMLDVLDPSDTVQMVDRCADLASAPASFTTLKSRTKTMRGLKSLATAQQFADGFLAFYNFLRPHERLDHRTPAEAAGIDYRIRTWEDVTLAAKPQVEVLTVPAKTIIVSQQVPVVRPIKHRSYKAGKKRSRKRKPASQVAITLMRPKRR